MYTPLNLNIYEPNVPNKYLKNLKLQMKNLIYRHINLKNYFKTLYIYVRALRKYYQLSLWFIGLKIRTFFSEINISLFKLPEISMRYVKKINVHIYERSFTDV